MRAVDTPDGKRLLVRAFAEDGVTVTDAFRVAYRYALLAGVNPRRILRQLASRFLRSHRQGRSSNGA